MMPVQGHDGRRGIGAIPRGQVPEAVARLAYVEYARAGHGSQSFERLHERGGFSWAELIACLRGEYNSGARDALAEMKALMVPDADD